ncbi:hypothetical protein PInf_024753 [Phytophthora infestans]|nr:hypothetical protein PInf_024753 [Phytophthora infestans]
MSRSHKCQATQTSVYPTKRCDSGPVVEPDAEPVLNRVIHPSTKFETAWTWSGEVDWIFFWNLALRLNVHDRIRVMMKSVIRYAPGVGWTMMLLRYPYINRNWTTDQDRLNKVIESYKDVDMGTWLAMFRKERRFKGFELCMDKMDPDYVVDLTVAYPELIEGVRPSPMRFVRGQFPTEVHMHVQRYHRSTLLKHKDRMGQCVVKS